MGWGGKSPWFSEYGPGGRTLFDARFRAGETNSYKAVLGPWRGRPTDRPAVAAVAGPNGGTTVYASWNGATEVAAWQVLAGPRPAQLRRVTVTRRKGFETAIALPRAARWVAARAIDRSGAQLGVSRTVRVR